MSACTPAVRRSGDVRVGEYAGLRMTAEQFFALPDDGFLYELVNGVVVMSPSPIPRHQAVLIEVIFQLRLFLQSHPSGLILSEVDVKFSDELVYRPELIYLRNERVPRMRERIVEAPDVVVEVLSESSRRYDFETKKDDYERFGVGEDWLIDPHFQLTTFYRLSQGKFLAARPNEERFASEVIPGFVLDLTKVRQAAERW